MSTPIATAMSGLSVSPVVTTTYVVKQVLDCSAEKWDTVVVYMDLVGIKSLKVKSQKVGVYPVPAGDFVELSVSDPDLVKEFKLLYIYNNLGQLIREEEIEFRNGRLNLETADLAEGVYFLQLKSNNNETVMKRFVISE